MNQVVLDGVCSVASEEIRMDAWGIDVVLTASQKGLGTPPGLSILVASQKALNVGSLSPQCERIHQRPLGVWITLFTFDFLLCQLEKVTFPISLGSRYLINHVPHSRWLPIMKAYESGVAAYFATPPVNLVYAFHASLSQITKGAPSLEDRFKIHRQVSQQIKGAVGALGLKQVPLDPAHAANGMTAVG